MFDVPGYESIGTLGEHLKDVVPGAQHHREHLVNEVSWHGVVEEIAHTVDKDPSRRAPPEW